MNTCFTDQKEIIKKDCKEWKELGNIVVFTNGCFDLLHKGHIDLLKASENVSPAKHPTFTFSVLYGFCLAL